MEIGLPAFSTFSETQPLLHPSYGWQSAKHPSVIRVEEAWASSARSGDTRLLFDRIGM
jgi:hypothetical protein